MNRSGLLETRHGLRLMLLSTLLLATITGNDTARAQEVQAAAEAALAEQDSACVGCELLPEYRSSPLLTRLRGCFALLSLDRPDPHRVDQCFESARRALQQYEKEPELEEDLKPFLEFLGRDTKNKDPAELQAELRDRLVKLRARAAALRAQRDSVVSLISQGGVSLGNWQAGLLYLMIEHLKQARDARVGTRDALANPPISVLPTITGASAGAVNGLIAASASCEKRNPDPEQSLFYRTWVNLGVDDSTNSLLGPESSRLALFSETALNAAMDRAAKHFSGQGRYSGPRCSVQFGLTLTHLNNNPVVLHEAPGEGSRITSASQRERFALQLDFGGEPANPSDRPQLRVHNMTWPPPFGELLESDAALGSRFPQLGTSDQNGSEVPVDTLFRAVRGSGAFPGAFPPVKLKYRRARGAGQEAELTEATFIDGGVFDNTPLGLAIQLESARDSAMCQVEGLTAKQCLEQTPKSLSHALVPLAPVSYVLVNPSAINWPLGNQSQSKVKPQPGAENGLVKTFLRFVSRFIGSSRGAALVEAAERWPFVTRTDRSGVGPSLLVPRRNLPIAGEQLGAFLAFLERDFRDFDFYVGMADGALMLEQDPCLKADAANHIDTLVRSEKFKCMRDYYRTHLGSTRTISAGDLPESCRHLTQAKPGTDPGESPNFRALLVAMHNYKQWTMRSSKGSKENGDFDPGYTESEEFDQFFAALSDAEFEFVDLPKVVDDSEPIRSGEGARRAVRLLMQRAVDQIGDKQPTALSRSFIRIGGRAGADLYEVLRSNYYFGAGFATQGLEAVAGARLIDPLRLDASLRLFHLDIAPLKRGESVWRFDTAATLGLTYIIPLWSVLDLEIGAGAVGTVTIATEKEALAAFRAGPRVSLGGVLLSRIYAVVDLEYFPHVWIANEFKRESLTPIVRDWRLSLGVGARLFLW